MNKSAPTMPTTFLRWNLLITDLGFIAYWGAAALRLFPPEWLYKDYDNPILIAWNWSFAPVDLAASGLGLCSLFLARQGSKAWPAIALLSVALTFCAGLMAISFWALQRDFELGWWLPNVYLAIWPLLALPNLARGIGKS
jgi:hypothetical protein